MRDAALLVALGALLTLPKTIQEAAGTPIATKHCPNECVVFLSRPIPVKLLQKYEKTTCGKTAVLLTTVKNKTFCANPKDDWVQQAMRTLDAKNAPPSPTVDRSMPEKRVMSHNVSGTAIPTSAQAGGAARPTETGGPARYQTTLFPSMRTGVSSMSTGSSAGSAPQPEVATHQPGTLANGSMVSSVADGSKTLGEESTTISPNLLTLSNTMSSPSSGPGPNSVVGPAIPPQRRNFTGQSSAPFGSDGSTTTPVNMTDRSSVVNDSTIAFGDASETSTEANRPFFHKSSGTLPTSQQESVTEKSKAAETSDMPEVLATSLPTILSTYRTHFIILAALVGLLCIPAVALALAKLSICTASSRSEMVQGLLFSPSKYQSNVHTNDIL